MKLQGSHPAEEGYERDAVLLRRYCHGESTAFDELFARHYKLVRATCRRELGENEAAEDATHAVFVLLAKSAKRLRNKRSLCAWLFSTSILTSRQLRRLEAREMKAIAAFAAQFEDACAPSADWHAMEPAIHQAMKSLRSADCETLLLRFGQELSYRQIGECLGIGEDAARMRVQRSIDALRRRLGVSNVSSEATLLPLLANLRGDPLQTPFHPMETPRIMHLAKATHLAIVLKPALLVTASVLAVGAISTTLRTPIGRVIAIAAPQQHTTAAAPRVADPTDLPRLEVITWIEKPGKPSAMTVTRVPRLLPTETYVMPFKLQNGHIVSSGQGGPLTLKLNVSGRGDKAHLVFALSEGRDTATVTSDLKKSTFLGIIPGAQMRTAVASNLDKVTKVLAGKTAPKPFGANPLTGWRIAIRYLGSERDQQNGSVEGSPLNELLCKLTFYRDKKVISKPIIRTLEGAAFTAKVSSDTDELSVDCTASQSGQGIQYSTKLGIKMDHSQSKIDVGRQVQQNPTDAFYGVVRTNGTTFTLIKSGIQPYETLNEAAQQANLAQLLGAEDTDIIFYINIVKSNSDE